MVAYPMVHVDFLDIACPIRNAPLKYMAWDLIAAGVYLVSLNASVGWARVVWISSSGGYPAGCIGVHAGRGRHLHLSCRLFTDPNRKEELPIYLIRLTLE